MRIPTQFGQQSVLIRTSDPARIRRKLWVMQAVRQTVEKLNRHDPQNKPIEVALPPVDVIHTMDNLGCILTLSLFSSLDRLFVGNFHGFPDFKDSVKMRPTT
jgi:hypothetical protein